MSALAAIMVIIRTMAAVDECRRSLPGMGHDFFDDVVPLTIFLAPVAMWRSDWEWARRGASVSLRRFLPLRVAADEAAAGDVASMFAVPSTRKPRALFRKGSPLGLGRLPRFVA